MIDNTIESITSAYKDFLLFQDPLQELIDRDNFEDFKKWLDINKDEIYFTELLENVIIPKLEVLDKYEWISKINKF